MHSRSIPMLPAALLLAAAAAAAPGQGRVVGVTDAPGFVRAVRAARPGTTVRLAPGTYGANHHFTRIRGRAGQPIVIEGADPNRPPVFGGGALGLHLSDCEHVTLRHVAVRGARINGINIDDGGSFETPARHIVLDGVTIENIGPRGNHDGLKMSGVDDFVLRDCRIAGWGGSAIDMVGCHDGVIESCSFVARRGHSQHHGVQAKGGSKGILIHRCFFDSRHGCQRPVNIGGSTGLAYFRPKPTDHEATDITVAGNRFVGGLCAVAWATARGGRVHHNTIYMPAKWVVRILQEQPVPKFKPCGEGVFEKNLVVHGRLGVAVNVGPHTAPRTFRFAGNAWYGPGRVRLPVPERGGIHGVDPRLAEAGTPRMRITSEDPRLEDVGADAYKPPSRDGDELKAPAGRSAEAGASGS